MRPYRHTAPVRGERQAELKTTATVGPPRIARHWWSRFCRRIPYIVDFGAFSRIVVSTSVVTVNGCPFFALIRLDSRPR